LATVLETNGVAAEAYRTLRTNLLHAAVDDPPKVVVITSGAPREGKTSTCANLAVTLAQVGKNTLAIDCDLRKPELHRYFGLRNLLGVVDVLVGQRSLQVVGEEPVEGLKVVPAGPIPPNPVELLDSRRFAEFLAGVREGFDYVLLDTPPLGPVSDAAILAAQGDGVLLVVDAQKTRKVSIRRSMRSLQAIGANVIGTVVNNAKVAEKGYYGDGYPQKHWSR
jgi:receptor protein-tyrosine kinase